MSLNMKLEEHQVRVAQRAYLYSIPPIEQSAEAMAGGTVLSTPNANPQQRPKPTRIRLRMGPRDRVQPVETIADGATTAIAGKLEENAAEYSITEVLPRLHTGFHVSATKATKGNKEIGSTSDADKTSRKSSGLKIRLRLGAPSPKCSSLRRHRRSPRINTRFAIPGSDSKTYVHGGKRYECPRGIMPWRCEHKWMLDPSEKVFQTFASRTPIEDDTYYYVPEEAMLDSSETREEMMNGIKQTLN